MPKRKTSPPAPKPKQKRRARGTGSIRYHEGRGVYIARVPTGKLPSGRTKYREVSAPTQAEVVAKMRTAAPPDPNTVTVREWAERWLNSAPIEPSTRSDYQDTLDLFVLPSFGDRRLRDVTAHDIERAAGQWGERKVVGKRKRGLGANTVRKNLGQLSAMFEAAIRARLVTENVVALAPKPKPKKVTIRPFTAEELARIVHEGTVDPKCSLFALLAAVGCRFGEALALDVTDYDAGTGRLSITRTYDPRHGLRRTKSENGIRTVDVPDAARPALLLARGGRTEGPLFTGPGGLRDAQNNARPRWVRLLKRLGITYRNPHQLRHSVATHSIAAGVHIGNVARDLGDNVQTIVKTYLHATSGPGVVSAMNALLASAAPRLRHATDA